MRVTPKISDRPAATRKSAEASASPLISWTSRLGSIFAWRRVDGVRVWLRVMSGDRYTGNVFGLQGFFDLRSGGASLFASARLWRWAFCLLCWDPRLHLRGAGVGFWFACACAGRLPLRWHPPI